MSAFSGFEQEMLRGVCGTPLSVALRCVTEKNTSQSRPESLSNCLRVFLGDRAADQIETALLLAAIPTNVTALKTRVDMYIEGRAGLSEKLLHYSSHTPEEKETKLDLIKGGTTSHYFPVFETVLKSHGQDYLIGNKLCRADIHLVALVYHVEEFDSSLTSSFPLLKGLKIRISKLPTVRKFLQPGSLRKFPIDAKGLEEAKKIFKV
ncbi:PREDICTED: glutathione S-transferase A2-like [Cercocebus atys]|uniref:glutathione S-transferase A2-like n=1 Tax=Cercocebus atys TaxID=9531 RepID=UPI0005F47F1C|nr:PREDICTED: glutathione S-transferase A2-like [Cercocebus atys]